ncbi:MAG: AraC family transcriptional regulator [Monoglobales bacterium]
MLELMDNKKYTLTENSLIIVKLSDVMGYYTKDESWSFKWLEFFSTEDFLVKRNTVYEIPCNDYESYALQKCFNLLNSQETISCLTASAMFSSVVFLWHNKISSDNAEYAQIIEKVKDYIGLNISNQLSVSELARKYNMSERTFRYAFKKHVGKSPKQYIEQKRLYLAMEYLHSSYIQIKELSSLLGFSNPYYFSRAFKKFYGNPPSAYIKKDI